MESDRKQPVRLYGIFKTHKFETLEDITVANWNFDLLLIRLERLYTMRQKLYRIVSDLYVKMNIPSIIPWSYLYDDTQKFPSMLSSTPFLQDGESLFTNIPIEEAII